jgi:catechol 2,3-dioxygenase
MTRFFFPRHVAAQRRSRHAGIDRAERFYTSVWGLEVVAREQDSVYLRATGSDHHVVALHASARPELRARNLSRRCDRRFC